MAEFNNSYELVEVALANSKEDAFKEQSIIVEVICQDELWLKLFPDIVVLRHIRPEQNCLFKHFIEQMSILRIATQHVYLDITIHPFASMRLVCIEHVFSF